MTDAVLMVVVLGAVVMALAVDLAALLGWLALFVGESIERLLDG
jgi:hypothetical protein